ncbi:carbohydrate-binding protein [Myceligenerans cantabricum]
MRSRRTPLVVAAVAAAALATGAVVVPGLTAPAAAAECVAATWTEGTSYAVGDEVTYRSRTYTARIAHTAHAGAGWNPADTPTLWSDEGACDAGPEPTPTEPDPEPSDPDPEPSEPDPEPTPSDGEPGADCAVQPRPTGKVLQGYWENWDGASNGVHPGMGWIPIDDPRISDHGYNVTMLAFPVILPDGTALWEDGMDSGVDVPSPEEMCAAKADGTRQLLSIGGATASIDLSSATVADRFVETIVPILQDNNFDGIDIDIEAGLTGSGDINTPSTSQANLIRIIDGVLARMPDDFGLTMAPETAYVTGGSVTYGGIWGAYLPIIKKYADNGRLWWLNMQYYNGEMYDCDGNGYAAGTVEGFRAQTDCLDAGLEIQGTTIRLPYDKQVPGLPAQQGAGGGYMAPSLVSEAYASYDGQLKGLMTWSVNWDGSKGWSFGDTVKGLQGR